MSNMIRKIKNSVSAFTGIDVNNEQRKRNRARTGLPRVSGRQAPAGLIYGAQGAVFNNSVSPKNWQHGRHYEKYNTKGRFVDLTDRVDPVTGKQIYVRKVTGQLVKC